MEPATDRPPCPRCGSVRLIGRRLWIQHPFRQRLPLRLYWRYLWQDRQRRGALWCCTYHCEVCGHQWQAYKLEQRPEKSLRSGV
jgi:hypothetical protein